MFVDDKAWYKTVKDKCTVANVHITKIEKRKSRGMYSYFFPPRIGIDFYEPENYPKGYHDFIPNLELGDIARMIKILELVENDRTFYHLVAGEIKPFEIGLAFERELKRRISVSGKSDHDIDRITIKYEGVHSGTEVLIEYDFTYSGLKKFVDALKEAIIEYYGFIQKYVSLGKIEDSFK